ncbi:MAG: ABC transporter ATP-binding protein [Chloroflexi bacterium]|nr:ABC transporter ATP-binding protein [Chloroflexota bacterium]
MVETTGLTKVYGDGDKVYALNNVDLVVRAGEFVAIVGPSGSGKSTLLNIIGALDRPSSGMVAINGTALAKVRNLDRFRNQTIGFVFQMHNLIPTLTAEENVEAPLYEMPLSAGKRRARAREMLALVGLAHRMRFLPNQLSGGERQRVAIARALANHPAIVLADEPTGNLDSKTTEEIMKLLNELNRAQGTTLIAVTHNHEVASATRRIITLRDGRIQSDTVVTDAFARDLIDFKSSPLGQAIMSGEELPPGYRDSAAAMRRLLEQV